MNVDIKILEILDRAATRGNALVLPEQLDRADYVAVDKVLKAAGGKWDRKARAHLFEVDAAEAIDPILLTGEVTNKRQELGQFFSPPAVAERVIELAAIRPHMRVLEPSAGRGALAARALLAGASVCCVEIDQRNVEVLSSTSYAAVVHGDFLRGKPLPIYDRVVMNPPFAKRADIYHVLHAAKYVRPGGRLVAVMSAGVKFRRDNLALDFREFLADQGGAGGEIETLPADAFKESGTGVNAVVVSFDVGGAR